MKYCTVIWLQETDIFFFCDGKTYRLLFLAAANNYAVIVVKFCLNTAQTQKVVLNYIVDWLSSNCDVHLYALT